MGEVRRERLEDVRRPRRIVDLPGPRRQPADAPHEVRLLERLPTEVGALDLADDRDDRHGVLSRCVDADRGVRRADRARDEDHLGSAGQLRERFRHERGAALVTGHDDADAGRPEVVEERQEALARDRETDADAERVQPARYLGRNGRGFGRRLGHRLGLGRGRTLLFGPRVGHQLSLAARAHPACSGGES